MSARPGEDIIEQYLHQLREALRPMPEDRRDQIVSDVAQHIAEARAEESSSDAATISRLLDRIGTPEEIAAAFDDPSDDEQDQGPIESYPTGRHTAESQLPAPIRTAIKLMYVGAAISIVTAIVDLLTRSELKAFFKNGSDLASKLHGLPKLTPSQLNSSTTDNLVMAVVIWLASVLLWVFIARASKEGQSSLRVTASALFGLNTLMLLIGPSDLSIRGPRVTDVCPFIVWLIGLSAIVLLWRPASSRFFNASLNR